MNDHLFTRKILTMIGISYGITWLFWFPLYNWLELEAFYKVPLTLIGGFGPALGGIITLYIFSKQKHKGSNNVKVWLIGALIGILGIFLLTTHYTSRSQVHLPLPLPLVSYGVLIIVVAIIAFVISRGRAGNADVRSVYRGIIPDKRILLVTIPIILFPATLFVLGNYLAILLGFGLDNTPVYQLRSASEWIPVILAGLVFSSILGGGAEEYGWRGFLFPYLQKRFNPLVAGLLVGIVWELWHLPMFIGDFYGQFFGFSVMRFAGILLISLYMVLIYNLSKGSVFLCIVFHACFNAQNMLIGSWLVNILALVLLIILIISTKMWKKDRAYIPEGL